METAFQRAAHAEAGRKERAGPVLGTERTVKGLDCNVGVGLV